MTIQSNRTLGGVGAIFSFLGVISSVSAIFLVGTPTSSPAGLSLAVITGFVSLFALVGFILFLIAMNGFSKDYSEHRIFNYLVYGIVGTIIAALISGVIWVAFFFLSYGSTFLTSTSSMPNFTPSTAVFSFAGLIWVIFVVKAFNLLAKKSEVPLFRTATFVLLAGAVVSVGLNVVFALLEYSGAVNSNTYLLAAIPGGLVQNFAWVLFAVAFFRIKVPPTQTIAPPYVSPIQGQIKYCPNCGTPNQADALFCTHCGRKL